MDEPLIFERTSKGKEGVLPPPLDIPIKPLTEHLPEKSLRDSLEGFPSVSEGEVIRHFIRLSRLNYAVDLGLYPLGSCTMKYNPKVGEVLARWEAFALAHPHLPTPWVQGILRLYHEVSTILSLLTDLPGISLHPAAGAHGELTGMMVIRKAHEVKGNPRKKVLIPDSAHGTNPASAVYAGYQVETLPSTPRGTVDVDLLKEKVDDQVAALMLTVPNTLGVFEDQIGKIGKILHAKGAYLYCDGANFNAFVGMASPAKMGVDVMHLNLHKTFGTPHGGGGPGAGAIAVVEELVPYLPIPRLVKDDQGNFYWDEDYPHSIGRIRSFYGQTGILIRALAYLWSLGGGGLREVAQRAVLNANYLRKKLQRSYHLAYESPVLHEVVFDDSYQKPYGVTNMDIAKRLLDYDFHPPTVSFPLIVRGALMIEPTETEDKEELDRFIQVMDTIAQEAKDNPEKVKTAPHKTPVKRLDEVRAARHPILRYQKP